MFSVDYDCITTYNSLLQKGMFDLRNVNYLVKYALEKCAMSLLIKDTLILLL